MKKTVYLDKRAQKELLQFPRSVRIKFDSLFVTLGQIGYLSEPFAKKLSGKTNFFEVRVKESGQWRAIYAYTYKDLIVVLSDFAEDAKNTS